MLEWMLGENPCCVSYFHNCCPVYFCVLYILLLHLVIRSVALVSRTQVRVFMCASAYACCVYFSDCDKDNSIPTLGLGLVAIGFSDTTEWLTLFAHPQSTTDCLLTSATDTHTHTHTHAHTFSVAVTCCHSNMYVRAATS